MPERLAIGSSLDAFGDQVDQRCEERRMRAHGRGPGHRHSQGIGQIPGFFVQVVQNFHVVGQETDRMDEDGGDTTFVKVAEVIEDIGR